MTALRAAAAAFKQDEQMKQSHSRSLRLAKHKRDGEHFEMAEFKRLEKVCTPKAIVLARFNLFIYIDMASIIMK